MSIESDVRGVVPQEYGEGYQDHLLEIYKLYVEMADKMSERRQAANSFFLSINTAVVALGGYVALGRGGTAGVGFYWLVGLAGMILCYIWYRLIVSYRGLNTGKFKVVHEIERLLPVRPYDAEWAAVGRGENPKLYKPFTHIEPAVPWVFFVIHAFVLCSGVLFAGWVGRWIGGLV